MNRDRTIFWLAWFLGVVFILMGLAELIVRIIDFEGIVAMAFWVLTLCGGGTLILVGSFALKDRPWRVALVIGGCVIASVASAWTLLLALLAVTLVVLTLQRPQEAAGMAAP